MKLDWKDIEESARRALNDRQDIAEFLYEFTRPEHDPHQKQRVITSERFENLLAEMLRTFAERVGEALQRTHPSPFTPWPAGNAPQKMRTLPRNVNLAGAGAPLTMPVVSPSIFTEAAEIIARPDEFLDSKMPEAKFKSSTKILRQTGAYINAIASGLILVAASIQDSRVRTEKKTRMLIGCASAISTVIHRSGGTTKPIVNAFSLASQNERRTTRKFDSRA